MEAEVTAAAAIHEVISISWKHVYVLYKQFQ